MTIDINLLRAEKGGNPDDIRSSEQRRFRDGKVVDRVIEIDSKWRESIYQMEQAKKDVNALNKAIGQLKKKGASVTPEEKAEEQGLMGKSMELKEKIPRLEQVAVQLEKERDDMLHSIGNIVHPSVPVSDDETNNKVLRTWGSIDHSIKIDGTTPGRLHHHEILLKLCGYEAKKGVEVAGHRGYYLKGYGVLLNNAIIQYGLSFLLKRGYTPVQPPFFMRREVMKETAELKDFEETLYRIPMGGSSEESSDKKSEKQVNGELASSPQQKDNKDDLFLIATSEQPISALHRGEFLEESDLPIRYAGMSSCFRKEAGSHGKDTWGIFRVHQFEKVEQFCIVSGTADKSWKMHEEMIDIAEGFYQSLNLPYRVIAIVSGALNDAASKKYDLEAWFPGYNDYRELVSCSNCTDFQSRDLEIREGYKKLGDKEKKYVHMLNGTLVASQRCLCCILENFQTEDGVKVPRALVPYMGGLEFLPFPLASSSAGDDKREKRLA